MANVFRIHNSQVFAKHQENIATSLTHRLEVARANHNTQLLALLEQEQRQLGVSKSYDSKLSSAASWLKDSWHKLVKAIDSASQLSVQQVKDENGEIWWYAFDPQTGKTLYAESEAEVVQWIEDHHFPR
jgi:hypothetical protein